MTTTEPEGGMEAVVKRFQELRSREQMLVSKIAELNSQEGEYKLVTDTLKPLEGQRKCYHLVGGVLCERTVADVLPVIESTQSGIADVLKTLQSQLKAANEERMHLQQKYGIRIVSKEEAAKLAAAQQQAGAKPSATAGVLA